MSDKVYKVAKESIRRRVIPYNGGAFAYSHAVARGTGLRLSQPLKDLWAVNMTTLVSKWPIDEYHGCSQVVIQGYENIFGIDWSGTMRIKDHRANVLITYLDGYNPKNENCYVTSDLSDLDKTARTTIYTHFVDQGWVGVTAEHQQLPAKLSRWTKIADVEATVTQGDQARRKLKPHYWNFQFRLIFNALPFARRLRKIPNISISKHYGGDLMCFLCDNGHDSAEHLYQECSYVEEAYERTAMNCKGPYKDQAFLACELGSWDVLRKRIMFNYAVWRYRSDVLSMRSSLTAQEECVRSMVELYQLHEGRTRKKQKQPRSYQELEVPEGVVVYFTDGSANPNPGPSGAGVYRMPQLRPELSAYASLGQGTNNSAELYAVGVVLDIELKEGGTQPLHIYTDSSYARGCLTEGWKTRKNVKLIENIIHLLEETRQAREVHLVWVK